jgi:hypothetical protein
VSPLLTAAAPTPSAVSWPLVVPLARDYVSHPPTPMSAAPILQAGVGQEAPFLEFIQRVCSSKCDASGAPLPISPGCGGFGIRNFLTLFL